MNERLRPDYGLHLKEYGISQATRHRFHSFGIENISLLGRNKYATMGNIVREGREFAMSVGFDEGQLHRMLDLFPDQVARLVDEELRRDPRSLRTIGLGAPVAIGIVARLGTLQRGAHDPFIPFIVDEVFRAPPPDEGRRNSTKRKAGIFPFLLGGLEGNGG